MVSLNGGFLEWGRPKSSISIGFSIINYIYTIQLLGYPHDWKPQIRIPQILLDFVGVLGHDQSLSSNNHHVGPCADIGNIVLPSSKTLRANNPWHFEATCTIKSCHNAWCGALGTALGLNLSRTSNGGVMRCVSQPRVRQLPCLTPLLWRAKLPRQ